MSVITKDLGVATAYGYAKSKGYTGTEEEFAELMASYVDVAQQAEASAQDAEDAKDAAITAKTAAQTAQTAAESAQTAAAGSAQTASTKASEASNSAQTAAGSATAAGNSATAAAGSASTAQTAAQTATTKASEASSSASAANTAKTDAQTARTGAQTAQTAAETAQANAEAAASSVSASAAQIEQNTEEIGALKNDFTDLSEKVDSAFVTETATGAIASFSDGADDVPVKDLTVAIEPVQDLHGQSAPYPAGGGKNLYEGVQELKTNTSLPIEYTVNVQETCTFQFTASSDYTNSDNYWLVYLELQDGTKTYVTPTAGQTVSRTIQATTENPLVKVYVRIVGITAGKVYNLQLEKGSSASSFAPYSNICPISGWTGANVVVSPTEDAQDGTTYTINWQTEAGTVYGGTLDVATGVLTVDRASVVLDGSATVTWAYQRANGDYYTIIEISGMKSYANSEVANIVSSVFGENTASADTVYASTTFYGFYGNNTAGRIRLCLPDVSTTQEFSAWLAEYQPQFVYELATPQTYQLTPEEVKTVLGQNNIFADCGNVTAQYRADTKLYIDKVLSQA